VCVRACVCVCVCRGYIDIFIDMIYYSRQLVVKVNTQIFILWHSTYPAEHHTLTTLWHEVTVDGNLTPDFEVHNGLRQGCVIAPSLFNLYFNLVISQWQKKCADFKVDILYKCSGKTPSVPRFHLARMEGDRVPKKVLFDWLPQPRPWHGTKIRWRDRVRKDLRKFDIERTWYTEMQERAELRQKWHRGLERSTKIRVQEDEQRSATMRAARFGEHSPDGNTSWQPFICDTCKRSFRRSQDIAQHKCINHHTPQAPLTETTSLIYHDPVYCFVAERHHPYYTSDRLRIILDAWKVSDNVYGK